MKQSKVCPKCGGTEIYTNNGLTKRGDRTNIPVSSWTKLYLATYICLGCGYIEEYVEEKELRNEKNMSKVKENWRKL